MAKRLATFAIMVLIILVSLIVIGAQKGPDTKQTATQAKSRGLAAIESAAKAEKYLFLFCYTSNDEQTKKMNALFDTVTKKVRKRASSIEINVADPAEDPIVKRFNLKGAPSPVVLVLAPNGALTGGFAGEFDEKQLTEAFATPCAETCLKALQGGKLVLLCIQNTSSGSKDAALKGVTDFKADARFSQVTQIVMLDPTDVAESRFLKQLQVDPGSGVAIMLLLTPPGTVLGKFTGATDKARFVTALSSASSGCCPSGSQSGCAPK